jgi:type II secretory pathway component PulK
MGQQRGSVLILVLIVASSMTILSVGLAYRTKIEIRLAQSNARRAQVYYLALGGIERIEALLSTQESSPSTIARICQFTAAANEEELFGQLGEYAPTGDSFLTYSLRDEQGYLNINKSDPASWENTGVVSRELRAGILDWIDGDEDTSPDGAETDFYERMEPPHASKNKPYVALKELLFLRGVTHSGYTGEDLNRNFLLDENERDGQFQLPADNGDNKLDLGLVDIFTVYGDGKININTASKAILSALPGLDEDASDIILAHRAGPDGQVSTDDDMYFESFEDISKAEGLTELQIEILQQYCGFGSEYFRIFSYAKLDDVFECCLAATLRYAEDGPRVLCLERML